MPICFSNHSIPVDKDDHDIVGEATNMLVRAAIFMVRSLNQLVDYPVVIRNLTDLLGGA